MEKIVVAYFLIFSFGVKGFTQTYITRNGNISFYSHTALEDIKAQNNEAVSVLNPATGNLEFKVAVKSFHFAKTAMEDHFNNDDYMASEKYPKAGFEGKITNITSVNFSKDGIYKVSVDGNLTIRDVTKHITAQGTTTVHGSNIAVASTFTINRKDYNVIGESFVQKKIAEEIKITINCTYEKE